jgi:hypothetical protein
MRLAIIIRDDATLAAADLDAAASELEFMQSAVGGYVQAVGLSESITLWCNEDGLMKGLAANAVATDLWSRAFGPTDIVVGDVVLTGGSDEEGQILGLDLDALAAVGLTIEEHA